jgi:hypothetical protein
MSRFKKYLKIVQEMQIPRISLKKILPFYEETNLEDIIGKEIQKSEIKNETIEGNFDRHVKRHHDAVDDEVDPEAKILKYDFTEILKNTCLYILIMKYRDEKKRPGEDDEDGSYTYTLRYYMTTHTEKNEMSDENECINLQDSLKEALNEIIKGINNSVKIHFKSIAVEDKQLNVIANFLQNKIQDMSSKLSICAEDPCNYLKTENDYMDDVD